MWETISKKDIIGINQQFDTGTLINNSSLEFALNQANNSGSWLRACALLIRAVLIDHVFEEGNKRTAAAIIMTYLEDNTLTYDKNFVIRGTIIILRKNITDLHRIEQVIKDALI